MLLRLALFLIFHTCLITCQSILNLMLNDSTITQFATYVNKTDFLNVYFKNPTLTVFVPSDIVLQSANLAENDKNNIFLAHMYESTTAPNFAEIPGKTDNWKQYTPITTASGISYYTMSAIKNLNRFYMYSIESAYYVNEAKIISPNHVSDKQVYHVIDRVLVSGGNMKLFEYLGTKPSLSTTLTFWTLLNQLAQTYKLPQTVVYKAEFLHFLPVFPGTVLVPTNEAWNKLDPKLVSALKTDDGIMQLVSVMDRYFIPNNLVFLRGEVDTTFRYGFNAVKSSIINTGLITKDNQVNIQGHTGKVIKGNIPINFGVVHLIDDVLYEPLSITQYLSINNNAFMAKLSSVGNFTQYLSGNYTIMALDDATVNSIRDPNILAAALLNSFIPGSVRLVPGKTTLITVGNVTIRLRLQEGNYFIDSLYSQTENTWINTARVISLNSMVGNTLVTSISGYISASPVTCEQMLRTLDASIYQALLETNGIKLAVGSPYTLFVPNDATVRNFTGSNANNTKSPMMQYILQRMIIANRLVLETKAAGDFNAVTVNYAAMKEVLKLTITQKNLAMSIYDVQQSFSFAEGGFYCYSNEPNDASRYNLIYPVQFILDTPLAKIPNFCVEPPCGASGTVTSTLLLLVISFLFVLTRNEILV